MVMPLIIPARRVLIQLAATNFVTDDNRMSASRNKDQAEPLSKFTLEESQPIGESRELKVVVGLISAVSTLGRRVGLIQLSNSRARYKFME